MKVSEEGKPIELNEVLNKKLIDIEIDQFCESIDLFFEPNLCLRIHFEETRNGDVYLCWGLVDE